MLWNLLDHRFGCRGLVLGLVLGIATPVVFSDGASSVWAQDAAEQDQEEDAGEQGEAPQDEKKTGGDGEPTLDELLGLGGEKDGGGGEGEAGGDGEAGLGDVGDALDGGKDDGPPTAKLFMDALSAMNASASRLLDRQDAGLVTQRHQEDVLLNLTMLIKQAEQQNQQKPSPGGKPQPQNQKPKPGEQQQPQPSQQPSDQAAQQDSRPPGREGDLEGEIAEGRSEWGNLPARIRDLLLQGRSESSASLYRRLTELYYKRLAEESEKDDQ